MGRKAEIIEVVDDAYGDPWDVKAYKDSGHEWRIAIGWPHGIPRGAAAWRQGVEGAGGPRVILTRELVDHLESVQHLWRPIEGAGLPLTRHQMKRLRRLLGHDRTVDRAERWMERLDDLTGIPSKEFAAKHGVNPDAVDDARRRYTGETRKAPAWWSDPQTAETLSSDLPIVVMAERLDRSIKDVWQGRYMLGVANKHKRSDP